MMIAVNTQTYIARKGLWIQSLCLNKIVAVAVTVGTYVADLEVP